METQNNSKRLTRISINLPTTIVEKVKDYADKSGLNVTSAYIVLLNQALEQKNTIDQISLFTSMYNELKNKEEFDFNSDTDK